MREISSNTIYDGYYGRSRLSDYLEKDNDLKYHSAKDRLEQDIFPEHLLDKNKCNKHDCEMMYDTANEAIYCPLCEK